MGQGDDGEIRVRARSELKARNSTCTKLGQGKAFAHSGLAYKDAHEFIV